MKFAYRRTALPAGLVITRVDFNLEAGDRNALRATVAELHAAWEWAQQSHLDIAHPLRTHRDGSVSFYIRDPDRNVVQALYEPGISPQKITP